MSENLHIMENAETITSSKERKRKAPSKTPPKTKVWDPLQENSNKVINYT